MAGDAIAIGLSPTRSTSSNVRPIQQDASMFNVFVSYSTADLKHVYELREQIADKEVDVFIAEHSVLPSESLTQTIAAAIKRCDLFVLLWSNNAKDSDWVAQELGMALQLKKQILPLKLEASVEPDGFIKDVKYIDVPKNGQLAYGQAQEVVSRAIAKKKETENLNDVLVFSGLALVAFWALSQS